MTESHDKIRIRPEDFERLKILKHTDWVRDLAVEQDLIDDPEDPLSYEDLMILMFPEDIEPISRSESEMKWIPIYDDEIHDRIMEAAGENVAAHEAVHRFLKEFVEQSPVNNE